MYKCRECGAEYDIKPDYCECGNDEFEQVTVNAAEEVKPQENIPFQKPVEEPVASKEPIIQAAPASKFRSTDSYEYKRIVPPVDAASLIIFTICLLLSFYVVFFAWNPKEGDAADEQEKPQTVVSKNIPAIDKFWNNTPPVQKTEPVKQEEIKPEQIIGDVVKQIIPTVKTVTQPKTSAQPQKKTTTVPLTKANTTKTTQTVKKQTNTTTQKQTQQTRLQKQQQVQQQTQQQQNAAAEAAKQKAEQERKAAEAAQIKKLQEEQAKKAAAQKQKNEQNAKQELLSYKAGLRNTIGRKIDFTRVIGDGSCTVSFRIDSNGKLINRSFSQQSTNNTLNDAVYAAVMSTPAYNPPPSAYKNEMLNLNIKFYNGNFEISLP